MGAVDKHTGMLMELCAIEHVIGDDGVQVLRAHLVRVTFCKCGGRSTLLPRRWATWITSP